MSIIVVDDQGNYIGTFSDGAIPPLGGIVVGTTPPHADEYIYDFQASDWVLKTYTPQEIDAQVDAIATEAIEASIIDKAFFRLFADFWMQLNPLLSEQEARDAVKDRLKVHIDNIRNDL